MFCVLPWDSWLGGVIEHLCDCFGGIGSRTQILLVDKIIQELFYSHLENLNAAVFLYLYILGYGGSSRCVYSNPCLRTAPQECPIPSPDAAPVQTRHPATFPFIVLSSWEVRGSSNPQAGASGLSLWGRTSWVLAVSSGLVPEHRRTVWPARVDRHLCFVPFRLNYQLLKNN